MTQFSLKITIIYKIMRYNFYHQTIKYLPIYLLGTLNSYEIHSYRACLLRTQRYCYTDLLDSFSLFWNGLDLRLFKFFFNYKFIFIFFLHFDFKNSVTKPCVILVCDWIKILRLLLIYSWAYYAQQNPPCSFHGNVISIQK